MSCCGPRSDQRSLRSRAEPQKSSCCRGRIIFKPVPCGVRSRTATNRKTAGIGRWNGTSVTGNLEKPAKADEQTYPGGPAADLNNSLPEILVLDDGGLGFRKAKTCWPDFLRENERPPQVEWVVLKMSRPLAQRAIYGSNLMHESWRERLIVIVSADQLRNEGLLVAGGLS